MSLNNINISVVIPVYNRASTIVACIESVVAQSYPVKEIIVIDDCSTDNTIEQLEIYKEKLIILKTNTQSGAQVARNIGVKAANSDWIAFLDSDDKWLPDKLNIQVEELEKHNFDSCTVIHSDCYVLTSEINDKYVWNLPVINGRDVYSKLLKHPAPMFQGMLISKISLVKIDYLDEKVVAYQEWDTAIRLAKYCKFVHIQKPLFIYYRHSGKTISSSLKNSFNGYMYIINKHKKDIIKYCGEDIFNKHLITNAINTMNAGDFKNGKKVLNKINRFSFKIILLKLCSIFHLKPKYPISIGSYIKGKI